MPPPAPVPPPPPPEPSGNIANFLKDVSGKSSHAINLVSDQAGALETSQVQQAYNKRYHFDDNPGRRSITEKMTSEEALQAAKTLARAEQGKFDSQ